MKEGKKREEVFNDYDGFVEKFKPKLTTDDCYTPENVYEVIADWVAKEYNLDREKFVRPFWPGGDYEHYDYPEGCVVVDNPPFSLSAKIYDFYLAHGIDFFLFAPGLVLPNMSKHISKLSTVTTGVTITYDNGARVNTSFVTSLDEYLVRTAPDLRKLVDKVNEKNESKLHANLPKYAFPDYVFSSAMGNKFSKWGVDYRIKRDEAKFIRALDSQRVHKKVVYGSGFLLSEKAAAERAAAEKAAAERAAAEKAGAIVWPLSDREREIIRALSKGEAKEETA